MNLRLTQLEIAAKLKVTRSTIQNWERELTNVPEAVSVSCRFWERRINQENPNFGPLTLLYSNCPLFVDACSSQRRPATIQQEPYLTNAVALARVQQLWSCKSFHCPLIIDASQAIMWDAIELEQVVLGKDLGAPSLVNLLKIIAEHLRASSLAQVKAARKKLSGTAFERQNEAIEEQARALDQLAHTGFYAILNDPSQLERICLNLLSLGAHIEGGPASNVAQVLMQLRSNPPSADFLGDQNGRHLNPREARELVPKIQH